MSHILAKGAALLLILGSLISCQSNAHDESPNSSITTSKSSVGETTPSPTVLDGSSPEFEATRKDRMGKLQTIMNATYTLVKRAQDKEVIAVWDFAVKNGRQAIPSGEQSTIRDQTPAEHPFLIAVITEEDAKRGEPWASSWIRRNEVIAHYERGSERNILILPYCEVSEWVRSIVILHEMRHARTSNLTVVPDTVEAAVDEELHTYEMQDRLGRFLGGKPYAEMLTAEVANVSSQLKGMPVDLVAENLPLLNFKYHEQDMPKAFPGLCKTPMDSTFGLSMFNRQAIFEALERSHPHDATKLKKKMLEMMMRMTGLIPPNAK